MSGKIMGMVWDLDLPHPECFVLLAITDHADHEGRNMHPGIALLAWKTGYSERTVQRILKQLVARGILLCRQRPGKTTVYDANFAAPPRKSVRLIPPPRGDILSPVRGDTAVSGDNLSPVTNWHAGGDTPSANVSHEPSVEPSVEESRARAHETELPDHLTPAQRHLVQSPESDGAPPTAGDGGATAYTLIEAWCDAWDILTPRYRQAAHRSEKRAARDLAALGATPAEIRAMCQARRAAGRNPAEVPLRYLALDYVGWRHSQPAATQPVDEHTAWRIAQKQRPSPLYDEALGTHLPEFVDEDDRRRYITDYLGWDYVPFKEGAL